MPDLSDPYSYIKKEVASTRSRRKLMGSFIDSMGKKTTQTPTAAPLLGTTPTVQKSPSAKAAVGKDKDSLMRLLSDVGFKGSALNTAYAVMMAESGGNNNAHNPNAGTGDNSYGLFQINMLGGMGPERRKQYGLNSNDALFDARKNAEVAYNMSKGGTNWNPWSTYKRGSHKKYL